MAVAASAIQNDYIIGGDIDAFEDTKKLGLLRVSAPPDSYFSGEL